MSKEGIEVKEIKGSWFEKAFLKESGFMNVIEKQKCKSAMSKLKGRFNTTYNNLVDAISDNATSLYDLRMDVENYDIQRVLNLKEEIKDQVRTLSIIREDYEGMFDKVFKSELSVEDFLEEILGEKLAQEIIKG